MALKQEQDFLELS